MKKKLLSLTISGALLFAAGCVTTGSSDFTDVNLYQPPTLTLSQGTVIQTKEGIYTAQLEEIWHSDKRYREIERKLFTRTTLKSSPQRVKIGLARRTQQIKKQRPPQKRISALRE